MKLFILILSSIDGLFLLGGAIVSLIGAKHTDVAGQGMVQGYAVAMLLVFLIFALPAFLLAYNDKLLGLALTLTIIVTLLVIFVISIW